MKYFGFDWVAMVGGLFGMYLLGSKSKYGFVCFMVGSSCWIVVGFLVNSLPLICGSSISLILQIRGLMSWKRENK